MLIFFLLISFFPLGGFSARAITGPVLSTCGRGNYTHPWVMDCSFQCEEGMNFFDYSCICSDKSMVIDDSGNCTDTCSPGVINISSVCINNQIDPNVYQKRNIIGLSHVTTEKEGEYQNIIGQLNNDYLNSLVENANVCHNSKLNTSSCEFLANSCALSHYNDESAGCVLFNYVFYNKTDSIRYGQYNIPDWAFGSLFLSYQSGMREVHYAQYTTKTYDYTTKLNFKFARYSKEGTFKGYDDFSIDMQQCHMSNDIGSKWNYYGTNFYANCYFSLYSDVMNPETDFFDPYIEDEKIVSTYIAPMPVIVKNYRAPNGEFINTNDNTMNAKLFRRFFYYDNYSIEGYIQYLKNITIIIPANSSDHHKMLAPYIYVEYEQISNSSIIKEENIYLDKFSINTPKFSFSIQYRLENRTFWIVMIIMVAMCCIMAIAYFIFRSIVVFYSDSVAGMIPYVLLSIIGDLFDSIGTALFVTVFIGSFYYLGFFKWTSSILTFLDTPSSYKYIEPMIWCATGIKLVGIICKVLRQSDVQLLTVELDIPEIDREILAYRHSIVANEWLKIMTKRSYNFPLTIMFVTFIIDGFKYYYFNSPQPNTQRYSTNDAYPYFNFAFSTFMFLLCFVVQWVFYVFLYWPIIVGNPFIRFVELCKSMKVSAFIMKHLTRGYYIHGRNIKNIRNPLTIDGFSDFDTSQSIDEVDSKFQTYEVFLEREFGHMIKRRNEDIQRANTRRVTNQIEDEFDIDTEEAKDDLNTFLSSFIDNYNCPYKYMFYPTTFQHKLCGYGPRAAEDPIFTIMKRSTIKKSLMYGIQLTLYLFYVLLYGAIEISAKSASIAALMVYIIDVGITQIFHFRTQSFVKKTRKQISPILLR